MVLRAHPDRYSACPEPADLVLAVEVVLPGLRFDLDRRAPRHAQAGIPELWVVDLVRGVVLRHRDPVEGRWTRVDEVTEGPLAPGRAPELVVDVGRLLAVPGGTQR